MFTTIRQAERDELGVSQLPDSPQITAAELKRLFDSLGNLAIDHFITHIDEISAETAASNIGVTVPQGYTSSPLLQSLLNEIVLKLSGALADRHTHSNKDTLDGITADTKQSYDDLVALLNGIASIQTTLSDSNTYIPTSHAVATHIQGAIANASFVKPEQLLDDIYPVGSIYQTTSATLNPTVKFGGVWELRSTESGIKKYERTA